ncbi:hypothetical protein NECAME_05057 [Necator americanus]|uniref:Uncharacterized protein n=1 Tax=Necator americanus TaxID=51031 RepID=W2SK16_NECAM|nr:hypothetical protein NECAME_05057 [Necator americanus]ETN69999.1 hypothetical protein NECAME_05057 [Necator americanus]
MVIAWIQVRTAADSSIPRVLVEKESNAFNMNDIMMEEVLREEKPDDVECVIEDAVSISTDVVEEVDESELSRLRLHSPKETPPSEKKEVDQKSNSSQESRDKEKEEITRRLSLELPSTSKADDAHSLGRVSPDSKEDDTTPTQGVASVTVTIESRTVDAPIEGSKSLSDIEEKSSSDSEAPEADANQKDVVVTYSQEEVVVEITPTAQKPFDPVSTRSKSIMYADTSSEEDSDEEEEHEIMPPVQRSQKIMNFDKIHDGPTVNGRLTSGSTIASNPFDDSSSEDEEQSRKHDITSSKEVTVTRIVVRDDGRPDELTSGSVKLSLDGREAITDEEFSEKLI